MRTTHARRRTALALMRTGLVLTVAAAVLPLFAREPLEDHVRAGYPAYPDGRIDTAVTTWLVILVAFGVVGVLGWMVSIRAVRGPNGRLVATLMFVVGGGTSLALALTNDTSGDVGLAPVFGWVLLAPCLAGLAAVALLWRSGG